MSSSSTRAEPDLTVAQLRRRIQQSIGQEQELLVDPRLFEVLRRNMPAISWVEMLLKRGADDNELTRYRYDVMLHVGAGSGSELKPRRLDWAGTISACQGYVTSWCPSTRTYC